MFCRNCGTDVTDMKYCPKCGTPTENGNKDKVADKKDRKYGLVMIGFVAVILICIIVFGSLLKRDSETIANTMNNDITPQREESTEIPVQSDVTDDKTDLKHEWWKDKAFQSADSGLYFWIEKEGDEFWFMVGSEYLNDQNCLVVGNVPTSAVQVGTDDTEGYIQYRFSDTVLQSTTSVCYFYNEDKVILLSKSDLNGQWLNESDTYIAVNGNSGIESKSVENRINYFFDGQRFECFETNSGEDMILTIYLFYDSDENGNMINNTPSMYKGVLSNGMEFWFEPYEISQDSETYVINCDDGSAAYLEYITNMSEINLLAESGMLYDYGGTYIGLPDSED